MPSDPPNPKDQLGWRRRVVRVERIAGKHQFVILGKAARRVPLVSRYTDLLDRELALTQRLQRRKAGAATTPAPSPEPELYYLQPDRPDRLSVDELVATLAEYDVISFDIFDTALFRTVDVPNDVFRIMGARLGVDGFVRMRKNAEGHARHENNRHRGSREVTLREIYEAMADRYGAKPEWQALEESLELELSRPNPFIKEAFDRLRGMGKTIVFMTDMYLPRQLLEEMLERNGYTGYEKIYLSNEYSSRKGDGTLQRVLLDNYGGEHKVVHVGDVLASDVEQSERVGLSAVFNPDQRQLVSEPDMRSLAGSFYRAVVNNALGSGSWSHDLHYTHGFRVGGILALGYCEFLEGVVREKSIDKILFCGRDCDVISRVYREFYGAADSAYVDISRYAIGGVTLDVNFDDFIGRSFFRWFNESHDSKTLEQLLVETGFDYLVPYLELADIEKFLFPSSANRRKLDRFFWDHKHVIEEHNRENLQAAQRYFADAVGDAKRVLVVDIGWSGTCISALRQFFRSSLPSLGIEVFGALMCTSRTEQVTDDVSQGLISAYVYSPVQNMDLTRFMMPGGRQPVRTTDLLHHPLEYLFTEVASTVTGYGFDGAGRAIALRGNNMPQNVEQIAQMQEGITDFVRTYLEYSRGHDDLRPVSGYVAFNPLRRAIQHESYSHLVYKDFLYDATPALFGEETHTERFGALFDSERVVEVVPGGAITTPRAASAARRIVFVSPEMIYTGAPRSLFRMCKVAASLGYEPVVWTAKAGPFAQEFADLGIPVQIVKPSDLRRADVDALVQSGVELVVCNTVMTDAYVRVLEGRVPLVWYVREASNLPDFFRSSPERLETLKRSQSICCVSDYAASAIAKYADGPIEVVRNSVEDVSALARPYTFARDGKHRFVQLGTIEQRKGYDLFVQAYKSMPEAYRERSELHFAGGFINSGASFSSYLFGLVADDPGIHFHGLVSNERDKVGLLSQMDTVVVASRDESCSLVALEGAMLSKPLIVTENVGAKYMVDDENGIVVESGSVTALREAFMTMIDKDEKSVRAMGSVSRRNYDDRASMAAYTAELDELFARRIAAGPAKAPGSSASGPVHRGTTLATTDSASGQVSRDRELIVSLTSIPMRITMLAPVIDSLLLQTERPDRVILWLSTENFPGRETELPADLLDRVGDRFRISWVDGDLAPHKKYFYAMQEFPDAVVVTVDDDVVYDEHLLEYLYEGHLENPRAIVCERANLVMFRPDGSLREYDGWIYDCGYLRGRATYQLLPTGIGGVLYPPRALPPAAFDVAAISATSLFADDLWLKVMATANGLPVWMPRRRAGYEPIDGAQVVGLWRANSVQGKNDEALERVLAHFDETLGSSEALLRRIRGVGNDGEFLGPEELDLAPLL